MLWTIMPLNTVLAGLDSFKPQYKEVRWQNNILLVEPLEMNKAKIIRIISTNPFDYLNPHLQPGEIINLKSDQPV
ncbi:MAG: hypothetical protein GX893_02010 [Firmicutes bacterium]|nr:hypothetical protein [Bacillota bacterium]